jgi:hypothetical protein
LTRWKKDEKEFDVSVSNSRYGSMICRVPKPVLELLGDPSEIKFIVHGKKIEVIAGGKK